MLGSLNSRRYMRSGRGLVDPHVGLGSHSAENRTRGTTPAHDDHHRGGDLAIGTFEVALSVRRKGAERVKRTIRCV